MHARRRAVARQEQRRAGRHVTHQLEAQAGEGAWKRAGGVVRGRKGSLAGCQWGVPGLHAQCCCVYR